MIVFCAFVPSMFFSPFISFLLLFKERRDHSSIFFLGLFFLVGPDLYLVCMCICGSFVSSLVRSLCLSVCVCMCV